MAMYSDEEAEERVAVEERAEVEQAEGEWAVEVKRAEVDQAEGEWVA